MPGDVLYTPLKWTHETHNIDPAITVAVHRPYPGKYSDRCGFGPGAVPEHLRDSCRPYESPRYPYGAAIEEAPA